MPRTEVAPPPVIPSRHGLETAALPPADRDGPRWELGWEFMPHPAGQQHADLFDICVPDKEAQADDADLPDLVQGEPFLIQKGLACEGVGAVTETLQERARQTLILTQGSLLEWVFWTNPKGYDTPYLADTTTAVQVGGGAPLNPVTALGELVTAAGRVGLGGQVFLHVTPRVALRWDEAGLLREVQQRLVTNVGGHVVVVGNGYPGTGPGGVKPGTGQDWIFATGPVVVRWGEIHVHPNPAGFDRAKNRNLVIAQRTATVKFDPAVHFAALVDFDPADELPFS